jgi:DNA modification methylase
LVEYFLERFTVAKDTIFDPFAGFGTTFLVAEAMNRIPYGIEYNEKRYEYVKSIVSHRTNIIHGDALKLLSYDFPKINFSITSPPYMTKTDHPEFPLTPPKALMNNI